LPLRLRRAAAHRRPPHDRLHRHRRIAAPRPQDEPPQDALARRPRHRRPRRPPRRPEERLQVDHRRLKGGSMKAVALLLSFATAAAAGESGTIEVRMFVEKGSVWDAAAGRALIAAQANEARRIWFA